MLLYALPHSGYCAKVRIALRAKGLDWREEPPPGGYRSDGYRNLVPAGNLPALVAGDLLIADSEAICEYLEEAFPAPPLLPPDPAGRAQMRMRARFHDTRLEPALRALYPHLRPAARDRAAVAGLAAELAGRLEQTARLVDAAPALPFGLGDLGYLPTLAWITAIAPVLDLGPIVPPALEAYGVRLHANPAVAAEMATFVPAVETWLASVGATG